MDDTAHGVRSRLAWYWRRVRRQPATVVFGQSDGGWFVMPVDPRPSWRAPRPQNWAGWQEVGYTEDDEAPAGLGHPFTPVPWMSRCGWLAHTQADRCNRPRRDHDEAPGG